MTARGGAWAPLLIEIDRSDAAAAALVFTRALPATAYEPAMRIQLHHWVFLAALGCGAAACTAEPQTVSDDAYQACVERGYLIGDLPYSATTFYQRTAVDRFWAHNAPASSWKSPVDQCNELRSRGQL